MTDPEKLPDLPEHVEVALKLYAKDEANMRRVLIRFAADERRRAVKSCLGLVQAEQKRKIEAMLSARTKGKHHAAEDREGEAQTCENIIVEMELMLPEVIPPAGDAT